jgi:hypothetical protein
VGHWLLHFLGLDSASGPAYLAWSGFGGDLSELAIVAALLTVVRRHNCHAKRCWRIGRHKVPGTDFTCCAKHTPGGAPTHARILALHREHTAPGTGKAGERLYDQERDGA